MAPPQFGSPVAPRVDGTVIIPHVPTSLHGSHLGPLTNGAPHPVQGRPAGGLAGRQRAGPAARPDGADGNDGPLPRDAQVRSHRETVPLLNYSVNHHLPFPHPYVEGPPPCLHGGTFINPSLGSTSLYYLVLPYRHIPSNITSLNLENLELSITDRRLRLPSSGLSVTHQEQQEDIKYNRKCLDSASTSSMTLHTSSTPP